MFREKSDSNNNDILCLLHKKNLEDLLSVPIIQSEHDENTIRKLPDGSILEGEGIKQARTIAVLIATADTTDEAFQLLNGLFPDSCLMIYRGNFIKSTHSASLPPSQLHHSGDSEKESQAWRQGGGTRP